MMRSCFFCVRTFLLFLFLSAGFVCSRGSTIPAASLEELRDALKAFDDGTKDIIVTRDISASGTDAGSLGWLQGALRGAFFNLDGYSLDGSGRLAGLTMNSGNSFYFGGSQGIVEGFVSVKGGFLNYETEGQVNVYETVFQNNQASEKGGALFIKGGTRIADCRFLQNKSIQSVTSSGGAFYCNGVADISRSVFSGNEAGLGGAIAVNSLAGSSSPGAGLSIRDCLFSDNTAILDGGALYFYAYAGGGWGAAHIADSVFRANRAQNGGGGAVSGWYLPLTIESSSFIENVSDSRGGRGSGDGGAVYSAYSVVVVSSLFYGNATFSTPIPDDWPRYMRKSGNGAAIAAGRIRAASCIFRKNSSAACGGALESPGGVIDVSSSLFENNSAELDGGAIALTLWRDCEGIITDCVFSGNTAEGHGGAVYAYSGSLEVRALMGDTVFCGNQMYSGGDSVANDIYLNSTEVDRMYPVTPAALYLMANEGRHISFGGGIISDEKNEVVINRTTGDGHVFAGEVRFEEGAVVCNSSLSLYNGVLKIVSAGVFDASDRRNDLYLHGGTLDLYGLKTGTLSMDRLSLEGASTVIMDMKGRLERRVPLMTASSTNLGAGASILFRMDNPYLAGSWTGTLLDPGWGADGRPVDLTGTPGSWFKLEIAGAEGDASRYLEIDERGYLVVSVPGSSVTPPEGPDFPVIRAPGHIGSIQLNSLWTLSRSMEGFGLSLRENRTHLFDSSRRVAFFGAGVADDFNQSSQSFSPGYRFNAWGYATGADFLFTSGWQGGVALSQTFGSAEAEQGAGKFNQDVRMAGVYFGREVSLDEKSSLKLDVLACYALATNKGHCFSSRVQPDSAYSSGRWDSGAWMVDLRSSWRYEVVKNCQIEILCGLEYLEADMDSFVSRSKAWDYAVSRGSLRMLRFPLGAGVRQSGSLGFLPAFVYARGEVVQDLYRANPSATVRVAESWRAYGSKPGTTSFRGTAGAGLSLSSNWMLNVQYLQEFSSKRMEQSARGSVSYCF